MPKVHSMGDMQTCACAYMYCIDIFLDSHIPVGMEVYGGLWRMQLLSSGKWLNVMLP